jgi:hypothetical protein
VLEHKTSVNHVERPPIVAGQRQVGRVSGAKLDQPGLAGDFRLALGLFDLVGVALDPQDDAARADLSRDGAGELSQPATDVEHPQTGAEAELTDRALVEQVVEPRQPGLLLGLGAVDVPAAVG